MRHYHRMDYPNLFVVLDTVLDGRDVPGFEPTGTGAYPASRGGSGTSERKEHLV